MLGSNVKMTTNAQYESTKIDLEVENNFKDEINNSPNSNFSIDSIPSENNEINDERDQKLKDHTTGRMPIRNVIATRGIGSKSNF